MASLVSEMKCLPCERGPGRERQVGASPAAIQAKEGLAEPRRVPERKPAIGELCVLRDLACLSGPPGPHHRRDPITLADVRLDFRGSWSCQGITLSVVGDP